MFKEFDKNMKLNENEKSQTIAFLLRIIALGLSLGSVYSAVTGKIDSAIWNMLSAIFFELYNIETRLRK